MKTVTPAQLSIVKQKLSALEHLDNQQLHDYLDQFDAVSAEIFTLTTAKECCALLNII